MVHRRRLTRVATSDDDEDEAPTPLRTTRKRMCILDDDNDDDNEQQLVLPTPEPPPAPEPEPELELVPEDAKPIGEPVSISGKGRGRKRHYESFQYDSVQYFLEDPVLLSPASTEGKALKPYVAIIKDITVGTGNENVTFTGQWFYRPEEAQKRKGGNWKSCDTRELFYSFHRDDVPAESVMHKCVVHFIPKNKQLPKRKDHPGFIVQKVYDTVEKKLWMLNDMDFEGVKQKEIDALLQKTLQRIGELPDIEPEGPPADEDQMKIKKCSGRKSDPPLDVCKVGEQTIRNDKPPRSETPASHVTNGSDFYRILVKFNVLTRHSHRDKWLERLLHSIHDMFNDSKEKGKGFENVNSDEINRGSKNGSSESANKYQNKGQKSSESFIWPDAAVSAIVALEKASYDALSSDSMKYNQKMRQLVFNLQKNAVLARHLLNGKLEPSKILNMTPNELKEGLIAEKRNEEHDKMQHLQMTDARCSKCLDCKVGLRDIIHAGNNQRYQLECVSCGYSWYAFRDEVSMPTIDASGSKGNIRTAP